MMWANVSAVASSVLTAIVNYGTDNYSKGTARRLRQTNAFNGFVVLLYGVFVAFYASVDWQALRCSGRGIHHFLHLGSVSGRGVLFPAARLDCACVTDSADGGQS